ncbi:MAG: DNA polymerase I [Eubacteriales bacterium]|nr:DNA polymerase I [Eubacteriales bacterium]
MNEKILLIDGHSILNRAFYGLPDLTNSEGKHTGAVYGFLTILFRILEEEKPDYLTVVFDLHAPTFRHEMYPDYKGTRKGMPEELREQVPLIKEVLCAMGISLVSLKGYEADDLLGTLAKRSEERGLSVTILSGDRDLLQLCTDQVLVRIPKTVRGKTVIEDYHPAEVFEKYGITPSQVVDWKALMGDSSDNIPGIPGIGEKTASKIIGQFGSIDNAMEHLEEIKPNRAREAMREHFDLAVLSRNLAAIDTESPLEYSYDNARLGSLYTPEAYRLFKRLDFKNLLSRFERGSAKEEREEDEISANFFTCDSLEGANAIFQKAKEKKYVGVQAWIEKGYIDSVAVALDETEIYYMPTRINGDLTGDELGARLLELSGHAVLCSMDVKTMLKGIPVDSDKKVFDVQVAAYLLNPLKASYPYDAIAKEYLGRLFPSREELVGRNPSDMGFDEEELGKLSCYMAFTALSSREPLEKALEEQGMLSIFREMEMPLIFTLNSMEMYGIRVKSQELRDYGEKLQVRIRELEDSIHEQAGENFNINSPKQLGVILFEKMGLPGGKKTKTGYSTAADILEKLSSEYPIVRDILEYRQLTKLKSTYVDGLVLMIARDGRIHSTFHQTITATGRISSTDPNLQNIPVRTELGRLLRKVFIPAEGYVFLDADYSQIELRVLAHMSEDEKLIGAYKEAQDIHRLTASQVFHVPFEEVTSLQRRNAKAVNFGIVYGISSFGLSQDLSITRKEAQDYIQKYFETYPKIKAFLESLVAEGKEKGYVSTIFGRRRPIPELSSSNFMQRSFGERVAMNSPIQGTAADIIKIAMNRVYARLKEKNLKSRLILQVHDELLIETAKDEIEEVGKILTEEMRSAAELSVALEVDMHAGETWYEAK